MKKILLLLTFFFAVHCASAQTPDAWAQQANIGGAARYGAVGFSIGTKGYVGTGQDNNGVLKKDFWEWDQINNTWTQKADFGGTARYGAVGFSIGTEGYVGTGSDLTSTNDFWEYDPVANNWGQKVNFSGSERSWATGFSIGSKGYFGTGIDSLGFKNDFWEFDPTDISNGYDVYGHPRGNWAQKTNFGGIARTKAVGFAIGTKGYIGTGGQNFSYYQDFWEYNSANNTWTQKANFGGGVRNDAIGFSIGTNGYIGMGYDTIINNHGRQRIDFWEWDQGSNAWTQKADFIGPWRAYAVSFSIGSYGYVCSGWTGTTQLNDLWEWEPHFFYKISGTINADVDQNCALSGGDIPLKNIIVNATPGTHYGYTNDLGQYAIYLRDTGNYVVTQSTNNSQWYIPCAASYNVSFSVQPPDSSTGNDFLNKADHLCPKLWVDIGNNGSILIQNQTAQYFIAYCNNGTSTSFNSYIDITFTDCIVPQSSTLPWSSVQGYTYRFNLGDVTPTQCGSFSIAASNNCSVSGTTQCISAHILPDSSCIAPDSAYDRRQLLVIGSCIGNDSVQFVLKNTHPQTITHNGIYEIFQNNVVVLIDTFHLAPGDSIIIFYPAGGNTIRLQTHFIYSSTTTLFLGPTVTIEGCGTNPVYGQIGQLPLNNGNDNYKEVCKVVQPPLSSHDPNDKFVTPIGITANHYISPNTQLEYQIDFQNTGNDTARYVMVRDTISSALDVTTFESGASIHPYTVNISGSGIVEWNFSNILLADSNVNEPASHGFVRFKISQMPNNPYGTIIQNSASIIFDSNVPVITDTTENVVCDLPVSSFTYNMVGSNTIQFNNASTNSSNYLWLFGDGTSDTSTNPVHIYTASAQYNVCLYATNSCESNFSCQSNSILTGLNEQNKLNAISIYPNPTSNSFIIKNILSSENSLLQILNPLGEIVYSKKLSGKNEYTIHHHLEAGFYFVQLTCGEKRVMGKLVVE